MRATAPRPTIISQLLDLALPPRCAGCRTEGAALCARCRPELSQTRGRRPGLLLGLPSQVPPPLLQLEWCSPFRGVTRRAIHELKYGGEQRLARPLGVAVAERWREAGAGGELLVPVPVHAHRKRDRGFDQSVLLTRVAAAELRLPWAPALERATETVAMHRLDEAGRRRNVAGAFRVRRELRPAVEGRWIVLVDDVATTGSTLGECARELLAAGAVGISAVTVARER